MDHFRPHLNPQPRFEGYYSNFTLPSKSRVILIICSVPHVSSERRPHMVNFVYIPSAFPQVPVFHREHFVDEIKMVDHGGACGREVGNGANTPVTGLVFELDVPELGSMKVYSDNRTEYALGDPEGEWEFRATVCGGGQGGGRVPWIRSKAKSALEGGVKEQEDEMSGATPEGVLVKLPLPLHWHVHSLASRCRLKINIRPDVYGHLAQDDGGGDGYKEAGDTGVGGDWVEGAFVHQEKNWAYSFPASHVWIQARRRNEKDRSGLCLAGGAIIGTQSYLITYHARDPANDVSYTPPLTSALSIPVPKAFRSNSSSSAPTLSPTLSMNISWHERSVEITVTTPQTRLHITASAPRDSFVGISAPFHDGHRENLVAQSFRARVDVKLYRADRGGLGHWRLVEENRFEDGEAGLEFGGDVYEDRGRRENT